MKKILSMITVTFRKEGMHCYPEALTNPELADVQFLGHPHRHLFWFDVSIQVFENNRDIEYFQFKRWLESIYDNYTLHLNNQSCEMMCDTLAEVIGEKYPGRVVQIKISEDGENSAAGVYTP